MLTDGAVNLGGLSGASNTVTTASDVQTTIHSVLAGSNGLAKAGSGTLVLAGNNNYSGATTISGTLAPGNLPGKLTLTNGLTLSGGGNYNW